MKLSILICTLESRKHFLNRLLAHLNLQVSLLENPEDVEILVESDNGELTTGTKRNILVNRAKALFICHWDDDDLTSPNSISKILEAVKTNPDCVGINLVMSWDGGKTERSHHYMQFGLQPWFDIADPILPTHRIYFRGITQINPVKRELALQVPFLDISQGEDRDYGYRLAPLLKTEVIVEQVLYFYLYRSNK